MKKFLAGLLTDNQGRPDEQAIISLIGATVFFGLESYAVIARGQSFDPLAFGTGIGTLMGATAAGFGLRAHLTPDPSPQIDPVTGRILGGNNARIPD
jgi:hypothetical protein